MITTDLALRVLDTLPPVQPQQKTFKAQPAQPTKPGSVAYARKLQACQKEIEALKPSLADGTGNNDAFRAACACFRYGLEDTDVANVMAEFNSRCQPAWSDKDIARKIESAKQKVWAAGEFGSKGNWNQQAEAKPQPNFELLTCEQVEESVDEVYLAKGLIVRAQPGIIGAIYKAMKTSIACDIAIALAIGGWVLGFFRVTKPVKVLFMSAESGMSTLKRTARSICMAAGIEWPWRNAAGEWHGDELLRANLRWCTKLPKMGFDEDLRRLEVAYESFPFEVLIIDPTYKAMNGAEASNLFIQGEMLMHLSQWCEDRGITLLLVHHLKKTAASSFEPAELADLSFSGFAEHVRWWILLSRRERYLPPNPLHKLWMSTGGSAGHSGLWSLDIDQAEYIEGEPRQWNVALTEGAEERKKSAEQRAAAKNEAKLSAAQVKALANVQTLLATLAEYPAGETKTTLRTRSGLNTAAIDSAIYDALKQQQIEVCQVFKAGRKQGRDGYRLASGPSGPSGQISQLSGCPDGGGIGTGLATYLSGGPSPDAPLQNPDGSEMSIGTNGTDEAAA